MVSEESERSVTRHYRFAERVNSGFVDKPNQPRQPGRFSTPKACFEAGSTVNEWPHADNYGPLNGNDKRVVSLCSPKEFLALYLRLSGVLNLRSEPSRRG